MTTCIQEVNQSTHHVHLKPGFNPPHAEVGLSWAVFSCVSFSSVEVLVLLLSGM